MPPARPRKEPKETVTYPASKLKPVPFKPQRPSQVPRVASTAESEGSNCIISRTTSANAREKGKAKASTGGGFMAAGRVGSLAEKRKVVAEDDNEDKDEETQDVAATAPAAKRPKAAEQTKAPALFEEISNDEDELPDPMTFKPTPKLRPAAPKPPTKRRPTTKPTPRRPPSPTPLSEDEDAALPQPLLSPIPPNDSIPTIPRPLLLRLLHEHFSSQITKIDKNAVAVLEKYLELFVRETIARATLAKNELVGLGQASQTDEGWLEKGDLERVIAGVVMDF